MSYHPRHSSFVGRDKDGKIVGYRALGCYTEPAHPPGLGRGLSRACVDKRPREKRTCDC